MIVKVRGTAYTTIAYSNEVGSMTHIHTYTYIIIYIIIYVRVKSLPPVLYGK